MLDPELENLRDDAQRALRQTPGTQIAVDPATILLLIDQHTEILNTELADKNIALGVLEREIEQLEAENRDLVRAIEGLD
jgi:hypothetical protein